MARKKNGRSPGFIVLAGFIVALLAWGLPMIGVTINLWLGTIVLAIAFVLMVVGFWQWEKFSKWHKALRWITVIVGALVYFSLVGNQIHLQYNKDHPKVAQTSGPTIPQQPVTGKPATMQTTHPAPEPEATIPSKQVDRPERRQKKEKPPVHSPAAPTAPTIDGSDNTVYAPLGGVPAIKGNGNTIVGATDTSGNSILNRGGAAIGNDAHADSKTIAIGSHAGAGLNSTAVPQVSAPNGIAIAGDNNGSATVYNGPKPPVCTLSSPTIDKWGDKYMSRYTLQFQTQMATTVHVNASGLGGIEGMGIANVAGPGMHQTGLGWEVDVPNIESGSYQLDVITTMEPRLSVKCY